VNVGFRAGTGIGATAPLKPADGADGHVLVAQDLARKADAGKTLVGQLCLFRRSHLLRFAGDKFDAAGRAAAVPATGMELVNPGLVDQRQHKALAVLHIKRSYSLDG
jgi:hypothetical protein